jgi:hypothetical protein
MARIIVCVLTERAFRMAIFGKVAMRRRAASVEIRRKSSQFTSIQLVTLNSSDNESIAALKYKKKEE